MKLPTLTCPSCSQTIVSDEYQPVSGKRAPNAQGYLSCLRRCEPCGLGFSNAFTDQADKLQRIHRDPLASLPAEIQAGACEVLGQSLNDINRSSKLLKFASEGSEDHLTWVIFRYLQIQGQLREVLSKVGVGPAVNAQREPTMLLWGSPVPARNASGRALSNQLVQMLERIGELKNRYSEPDVLLDFGETGVVFIEVKHLSGNEVKDKSYPNWPRYIKNTDAFKDINQLLDSGLYELARNWRVAYGLAGNRPFAVVNLGPQALFEASNQTRLELFKQSLNQSTVKEFDAVTWPDFLNAIASPPNWLDEYLDKRLVKREWKHKQ
jgi:Holliday junction resolvase-like predicted endonuclease